MFFTQVHVIVKNIVRDREEPCLEFSRSLIRAYIHPRLEERILRNIRRKFPVAGRKPHQQPPHRPLVLAHQGIESAAATEKVHLADQ